MSENSENNSSSPATSSLTRLRQVVTLGALALAFTHLIWPSLAIDAITLGLLFIAIVPWLAPLVKSLELPGGWKVEFQEMQKVAARAESAGLLSNEPETGTSVAEHAFLTVADRDPNLALAGLRIEIEKRLLILAEKHQIKSRSHSVGQLLRVLDQHQVLSHEQRSVLADLVGLLNSAVHGATVDPRSSEWAIHIGPRLLLSLDDRINSVDA